MKRQTSLYTLLRPYWKIGVVALAAMILESGADLLEPWPLKVVLDYVIGSKAPPAWLAAWTADLPARLSLLKAATAAVLGIALVGAVSTYAEKYASATIGKRVKSWKLSEDGFRAIAPGLKDSVRRAREGMVTAWLHPNASNHHTWRRHVKNHWFHVRLLQGRCNGGLQPYQHQLEALDGVLGEYHNVVLLREVLVTDQFVSREETARCLRVVAQYQRVLRRHAEALGVRIYSERPRRFVRRVRTLWRNAPRGGRGASSSCAHSTP